MIRAIPARLERTVALFAPLGVVAGGRIWDQASVGLSLGCARSNIPGRSRIAKAAKSLHSAVQLMNLSSHISLFA